MINFFRSLFLIIPLVVELITAVKNLLTSLSTLNKIDKEIKNQQSNLSDAKGKKDKETAKDEKKNLDSNNSNSESYATKNYNTRLNELENRSFFVVRCKNNFYDLEENIRKLPPEEFKARYLEFCVKSTKKEEFKTTTQTTTTVSSSDREKQKNVLINKIYFIANKYGLSEDFEKLPKEIKELNPEDFKNYAKKTF